MPNIHKSRDTAELQDLYRSALAATWCAQPEEHPASAVVEDIFSGGNGWALDSRTSSPSSPSATGRPGSTTVLPYPYDGDSAGSLSGDEGYGGTLRPSDFRRAQRRKLVPERSERTLRAEKKERSEIARSRSGSLASLAPTLGSSERELERDAGKGAREVTEAEARDDMVAWRLSGRT